MGIHSMGKDRSIINEVVETHNPSPSTESHYAKLQQISNQQATVTEMQNKQINRNKHVPLDLLLSILIPQLPKDRAMQIQTLSTKLKKDEIQKDSFLRLMKSIIGGQMLRLAFARVHQARSNQGPVGQQHPVWMPTVSSGARQFNDSHALAELHQRSMNVICMQKLERQNSFNVPKRLPGGSVAMVNNTAAQQTPNKDQSPGFLSSGSYVKKEPNDLSTEQQHGTRMPSVNSAQIEQGTVKDEFSRGLPSSTSMPPTTSTGLMSVNCTPTSAVPQLDSSASISCQVPSSTTVSIAKPPLKKPSVGQKKPLEALGSSPPPSSKKQKTSRGYVEQSIDQLNHVTAVSGVDLMEEEEQLFSGPKEDSRFLEGTPRAVQEEEERLLLQKAPLQKKLIEISHMSDASNFANIRSALFQRTKAKASVGASSRPTPGSGLSSNESVVALAARTEPLSKIRKMEKPMEPEPSSQAGGSSSALSVYDKGYDCGGVIDSHMVTPALTTRFSETEDFPDYLRAAERMLLKSAAIVRHSEHLVLLGQGNQVELDGLREGSKFLKKENDQLQTQVLELEEAAAKREDEFTLRECELEAVLSSQAKDLEELEGLRKALAKLEGKNSELEKEVSELKDKNAAAIDQIGRAAETVAAYIKAQVKVIAPELDLSLVGVFTEIKDGQLVVIDPEAQEQEGESEPGKEASPGDGPEVPKDTPARGDEPADMEDL